VSAAQHTFPYITAAKEDGLPLTVETCPHYLFFTAEDVPDGDTRFKCAPPIRPAESKEWDLWFHLYHDWVDTIGSDHSPAPPSLKYLDTGDLRRAWGGIASVQLSLPVVWTTRPRKGHLCRIDHVIQWMATRPASLVGLGDRKGAIVPGNDADLVVFDPTAEFTVTPESLHHRHKLTPYVGQTLRGVVETTYLRGRRVYDRGRFLGDLGGQLLERSRVPRP
jgi:allantoinase